MRTYSDAHLEHYADRFIALRMARHGVNLAQYLINPTQFERLALEPEPLLPAQAAAVLRIWQRWDTGLATGTERVTTNTETNGNPWDWSDLLEQWREEVAQSERGLRELSQRNGAYIERMRHHRHHGRSRAAHFAKRGA
tara:strand:- start:1085 stop:1501 length:417 start_codon:yes stop_codon:yes gene_type:complete